jgi:hypothetical protein
MKRAFLTTATTLALSALLHQPATAQQSPSPPMISQIMTVEGNTIAVSSNAVQGAVTFNGQRIIDSDDGAVMAQGTYPAAGKTFLLFETDQGPSCAMFRVIAVAGRQASVSPVFGNCGAASASVVNGALRVHLAVVTAHGTFPTSPAETHSFDGSTFR